MRRFPFLFLVFISVGFALAQATKPAEVPTSAKDRKVHPATQPGQVLEISLAELGNFDFDPEDKDAKLPDDVKALSGVAVKLHGFMIPMDQADNITQFALVTSLERHNWQPPPPIQQTIVVTCPAGKSVKYCADEITVQGKLTVAIMKDDGFIVGIFAVETTSVKPAPK
jgi:hypothetical protein